jgi:hypothetical protein
MNLIFLLVGALILMVFILLLKVYRRRQTNPNPNFFPPASAPIQFIDPQAQLNDQIKAHTLYIQELQAIKNKYLMSQASSTHLEAEKEVSADSQPATPTFKQYTFRNA